MPNRRREVAGRSATKQQHVWDKETRENQGGASCSDDEAGTRGEGNRCFSSSSEDDDDEERMGGANKQERTVSAADSPVAPPEAAAAVVAAAAASPAVSAAGRNGAARPSRSGRRGVTALSSWNPTARAQHGNVIPPRDRVHCLREFILSHFALEYLRSGPVLDVAGGKGDLSWLLANADGVDSVVVDPRVTDHSKIAKTALWYAGHPREADEQASKGQPLAALGLRPPFAAPRHLQTFLDSQLLEALQETQPQRRAPQTRTSSSPSCSLGDQEAGWAQFWDSATARAEAEVGTKGHHQPGRPSSAAASSSPDDLPNCRNKPSSGRIADPSEARDLLTSACLVAGFHPDQATEPCVDLALRLRVPFVVCPCCTFPKHFPDRKLLCGRPVSTYEEFLVYLRAKHPRIRTAQLDFGPTAAGNGEAHARSTVLYTLKEDYLL